jgi:hypothetical protein
MLGKCVGSDPQASERVIPLPGAPVQIGIGNEAIFVRKRTCVTLMCSLVCCSSWTEFFAAEYRSYHLLTSHHVILTGFRIASLFWFRPSWTLFHTSLPFYPKRFTCQVTRNLALSGSCVTTMFQVVLIFLSVGFLERIPDWSLYSRCCNRYYTI